MKTRLTFPVHPLTGSGHVRVMHGNDCVLVSLEEADYRASPYSMAALEPREARALARALLRQARYAEEVERG